MSKPSGNVTVAMPLLLALVRAALRDVPGVIRLARVMPTCQEPVVSSGPGAALINGASGVVVECAVIAAPGIRLNRLAATAQAAVVAALAELAGVRVVAVNVSIEDIATATSAGKTRDDG